jgi:AcrR family transcriptional regulator
VAAERGYDALRFSDVSAATEVPVSSLQYYFGSRDRLVAEALRWGVRAELARCRDDMRTYRDPWVRMCRFIAWAIDLDDSTRREGWIIWTEYWRAAMRDPAIHDDAADVAAQWRGIIREIVTDGISSGRFEVVGDPEDAIAEILALADGLAVQLMVGDPAVTADTAVTIATAAARRTLRPSA